MNFLRRNVYALLFLAVLTLSTLLIARQYLINESGHVRMREDFLLLQTQGHPEAAKHLYQKLVQDIGKLSDLALVQDQQRLDLLAIQTTPPLTPDSLLFKYRAAVLVELERRNNTRVSKALERAQSR